MRTRYRISLTVAALTLLGPLAASASAQAGTTTTGPPAVAYQISVSHDGYSGDTTITAPLKGRWK